MGKKKKKLCYSVVRVVASVRCVYLVTSQESTWLAYDVAAGHVPHTHTQLLNSRAFFSFSPCNHFINK